MSALKVSFLLPLGLLLIFGCSLQKQQSLEETRLAHEYSARQVTGGRFQHRIYLNQAVSSPVVRLHVYIDGDGTPWLGAGRPAPDPTPRNPLVLRLMALDSEPALYLGRPCHAGVDDHRACHPWYWTHGRYAEVVVESMTQALGQLVRELGVEQLVLIGFSGGGTLAMLLASRLTVVTDVVTLAGNLNVQAWIDYHGYSPLTDSLDPAKQNPLPSRIRQWHWVGADDLHVPAKITRKSLSSQPDARLAVLPGIDHSCCWEQVWPHLLHTVNAVGNDPQ